MQDRRGFLWVGTRDGLNRFDGYTFKVYRHNPQDPASLSFNGIVALLEDRAGTLWIAADRGGLCRYDRGRGDFTCYKHDPQNTRSLSNSGMWGIYEDRRGALWVGTSGGLNRFDLASETFQAFQEKEGLANDTVYAILEDERGRLWLSTNRGIYRFNPEKGAVHTVNDDTLKQ